MKHYLFLLYLKKYIAPVKMAARLRSPSNNIRNILSPLFRTSKPSQENRKA